MAQLPSLADAPGTLREYETIYILKPDTQNERVAELNGRVRDIIESRGGKILKVDNWGKRRLAYEVKRQLKGIYLYWQYLGSPDIVHEFERNMRMLDPVIRYMTVKVAADVNPGQRASEVDDEAYERAANTAADEEDLMMGGVEAEAEGEGESEEEPAEATSSEEGAEAAPEGAEKQGGETSGAAGETSSDQDEDKDKEE